VRTSAIDEALNFEDELRRLRYAEPFVPFTVVMASRDRYQGK